MSWQEMETQAPELAAFGRERFQTDVAYLATVRKDGSPRVHPVTPILGEGRLFVFMEPSSPKGKDLQRGSGYAMHSLVGDSEGTEGEFVIRGKARLVEDSETRVLAARNAGYEPAPRYILFELSVEGASSTVYEEEGPKRARWKRE